MDSPIEKEFEQVLNTFPEEKMKEIEYEKFRWFRVWAVIMYVSSVISMVNRLDHLSSELKYGLWTLFGTQAIIVVMSFYKIKVTLISLLMTQVIVIVGYTTTLGNYLEI